MNQSQINQVKVLLERFSSMDLGKQIASKYGDDVDLMSVSIGEYSAKEYISIVKKIFMQFSEEINGVYAKAMPFQYNFQNEYGAGNLHQDLMSLVTQIKASNFPASIPQLNKLIH
ncbi:MAG: hypothetical protein GXP21_09305, partial [Gammaproteobacteria bacterium]|nr:hypothetical protein [Gammaproteobacteria bacterium]